MSMDETRALGGTRERSGRTYVLGTSADVGWIHSGTTATMAITSAIPPVFDAYATVVLPDKGDRQQHDEALLAALNREVGQHWWLGYLERGPTTDVVFPDAPRVMIYTGGYVLIEAGSEEAARFRTVDRCWPDSPLPDLIFPRDRSWLVSKLWDDDWYCVGGTAELVAALAADPRLDVRQVAVDQHATPPGHVAI